MDSESILSRRLKPLRRTGVPDTAAESLKTVSLDALHRELGAKMVPFAGYSMPVNYPLGVLKEHLQTRAEAGLFDVSHMGQAELVGEDVAEALETLVPGDIRSLKPGQVRYTLLLNDAGGIIDDLMVTRPAESGMENILYLVVNAACKDGDFKHIADKLVGRANLKRRDSAALLALQGPKSAAVLDQILPGVSSMDFMTSRVVIWEGMAVRLFRSGYTGEDGYEISIEAEAAERFARILLTHSEVQPIGLGARDSLRLEAGLCLYGSDINITTTPVEASLTWVIGKRRRDEGGFPGAVEILGQVASGALRKRIGIRPLGRAPARGQTEIQNKDGDAIGKITSGGFGPSVNGPIAMGYVEMPFSTVGTPLTLIVRGHPMPAEVAKLPFVRHRYFKP